MLQRAASNAYSWWVASHIRTKQSKWLEQNLQDMEEKVSNVLKLIEEDGDSFRKRAEMYYKKRPELINFVEESYRAYRALAERYDHISTELQNANTTLASCFPDQVALAMDDDDDVGPSPRFPRTPRSNNIPKAPKTPKGIITPTAKKLHSKSIKAPSTPVVSKSGLSKDEGVAKIDKLQKRILALQTEKEFMTSSYESGIARCWEIDKEIEEMQDKICNLQDEFGASNVIEDDEARTLMAEAALKSCQSTLSELQEKQERTAEKAGFEQKRIKENWEKLRSMKQEFLPNEVSEEEEDKPVEAEEKLERSNGKDWQALREKIKEHFEVEHSETLDISEMAEKIDELVNKVVSLETAISSQEALILGLKTESDELQGQIQSLEGDKAVLMDDKDNLSKMLKEMEQRLRELEVQNRNLEDQNNNFQTHFTEAQCNFEHLSEKMEDLKAEAKEVVDLSKGDNNSQVHEEVSSDAAENVQVLKAEGIDSGSAEAISHDEQESATNSSNVHEKAEEEGLEKEKDELNENVQILKAEDMVNGLAEAMSFDEKESATNPGDVHEKAEEKDELNWKQMFLSSLNQREKTLLVEYTSVLRNFKEMKKKFSELENNNQNSIFEFTLQLKELKSSNATKDEEIRSLRQQLSLFLSGVRENNHSESPEKPVLETVRTLPGEKEVKVIFVEKPEEISPIEEKFRMSIDELLEENLNFWLRFSTSFSQVQSFDTSVKDLLSEVKNLEERQKVEGSSTAKYGVKSDVKPIYKHLREIQTELIVWQEKGILLKEELKHRFSSLCSIQEEITKALKDSAEDDAFEFTSFQAAKFQGEILNMKQENNKVEDELQAGLDHVTTLHLEVERTLAKLNEEFALSGTKNGPPGQLQHTESRSRVPLRSFIFGSKSKKQKSSIFSSRLHRLKSGSK